MKRFILPLVIFLILAGFLAVGLKRDPKEVPSPLIGKPVPAFALATLHAPEKVIRHTDLVGKVWILNVWASWCGACREEHPTLVAFARSQQVPIYGLDYKDERNAGQAWLNDGGNPYAESLFDESGRVGIDFGVYGVPETFVIDRLGIIRYKHIGPLTPAVLQDKIQPLLKQLNG